MPSSEFKIAITPTSLEVRLDAEAAPPRQKLLGLVLILSLSLLGGGALLFLPGKHDQPSMWSDLVNQPFGSSFAIGTVISLVLALSLITWQGIRYARAAWPSDETLLADDTAMTLSRVPWLDYSNSRWKTTVFPRAEVTGLRYSVIASAKGRAFYGIRFLAHGRRWVLPDLPAVDAQRILKALQALGYDVPDDPKLQKRIDELRSMEMGDTSWLDTSWMNHEPQNRSDKTDRR